MAKRDAGEIGADIDDLFQLPLSEFTGARNALAARLKKEGRGEEAERVKALAKPPASAWAVNQLYWRHRKPLETLLALGDRFREAQAAQLAGKGGDLRGLLDERRQALAALLADANAVLRDAGHAASPDMTRRIGTTLEALATYGRTPGAPPAGRLTRDIDPPGFEALAALVPRPRGAGGKASSEPTRVLPFHQEGRAQRGKAKPSAEDEAARRAKAREAVHDAEQALRAAQRDAERAEAALKKAAARAKAAEKERAEIEQRFEKAQAEAQQAAKEARQVAQEAEGAAQAVTDAERELDKARTALDALQ